MLSSIKQWLLQRAWPFLGGLLAAGLGYLLFRSRAPKAIERTPEQRRQAERDDETLRDAVDEYEGLAKLAKAQADRAGARAAGAADAAGATRRKLDDMTPDEARAAVERAKARLRRGGLRMAVLAALLSTGSARADEPMAHPVTRAAGWWLAEGEHLEIDAWILELDARRTEVAALNAQVALLNRAYDSASRALVASEVAASVARSRAAASEARANKLAAWYRSPRFVAPTAFVLGLALPVAVALAVQ